MGEGVAGQSLQLSIAVCGASSQQYLLMLLLVASVLEVTLTTPHPTHEKSKILILEVGLNHELAKFAYIIPI